MRPTNTILQRSISEPSTSLTQAVVTRSISASERLANGDRTGWSDTCRNVQDTLNQISYDLVQCERIQIGLSYAWRIMPTEWRGYLETSTLSIHPIRLILNILLTNRTFLQFYQWSEHLQDQIGVENSLTKCIETIQQLYLKYKIYQQREDTTSLSNTQEYTRDV